MITGATEMKISLLHQTDRQHPYWQLFRRNQPALALTEVFWGLLCGCLHALTATPTGRVAAADLRVAASWMAFGLDTEKAIFFRQSDIHEIPELTTILSAVTPKGLMNRAHAYKATLDKNAEAGRDPDDGVNMGLYTYPILMAADILLYDSDVVPVGLDQKQHVEIARDMLKT